MRNETGVPEISSILVIRRDNIGDLVCTTPLLTALRRRFATTWIGVLANSYNAAVLNGNPDIDQVYAYRKLKHLDAGDSALSAISERIGMMWALRRRKLGLVVLAAGPQDIRGARIASILAPCRTISSLAAETGNHEVERTFSAARLLGIEGPVPPLKIIPDKSALQRVREGILRAGFSRKGPVIGLHISARRSVQRWPEQRFADLAIALSAQFGATAVLLWSPGARDHPRHPGDDDKAKAVLKLATGRASLFPFATSDLPDLIAGIAACDAVVCSDGGAMHLAAALGKPIVCFFGDSPVDRWRPWGVRHTVLQAASGRVEDIPLDEVLEAYRLLSRP